MSKVNQTPTNRIVKEGQEYLRVNMSGKDYDLPFKVLAGKKVAFLDISGQVKASGLGFFGGTSHADSRNNSCDDARFLNRHFELLWAKPCLNDGINLDCHCKN